LLARAWDKLAIPTATEPKRDFPTEVAATRLLVGLDLANSLADSIALGLPGSC
jgi:hypothetical protein